MEGDHLVVTCQLARDPLSVVSSYALIDNGATGFAFMDEDFARRHQFPLIPLKQPRTLEVIDGRPIASGMFTHCHGNDSDLQTTMDAQSVSRIQDLAPTPWLSYCNHLRCYSIRQRTEDGGTDQG